MLWISKYLSQLILWIYYNEVMTVIDIKMSMIVNNVAEAWKNEKIIHENYKYKISIRKFLDQK
jgi:hypothetical protein